MRWWAGMPMAVGLLVLAACSGSTGDGSAGASSGSPTSAGPSASAQPSASASASSSAPAASPSDSTGSSGSSGSSDSSASEGRCAAGHTDITVSPGDAVERRVCVRPGTVVSLVLEPRIDDKRWTAVRSSAPVFVLVSGWRVDADGTARASLRCAGTRAGAAVVTASAKAPDVAGAARVAFTLHLSVVPYTTQG